MAALTLTQQEHETQPLDIQYHVSLPPLSNLFHSKAVERDRLDVHSRTVARGIQPLSPGGRFENVTITLGLNLDFRSPEQELFRVLIIDEFLKEVEEKQIESVIFELEGSFLTGTN